MVPARVAMDKDLLPAALKGIVNFRLLSIDNITFRLHYLFTAPVLLVLSIAVTLTQYFGEPISCIQRDDIPEKVINTYCWIESTYSLPNSLGKRVGDEIVYPGVERYRKGEEVIEHAYYQWVCFVLFLQGLMFYTTRALWEAWEGGKVGELLMDLDKPLMETETIEEKCRQLSWYFYNNLRRRHNVYTMKYFICEVLNFINALGQMCLINRFLGGEFTTYGYRVFQFMNMDQRNRTDPMIRVFPRVTKCIFHKFGSAGSVQTHDSLCVLPLNIVNEKIYVFLWLWLLTLTVMSGLAAFYRLLIIQLAGLRAYRLKNQDRGIDEGHVETVMEYLNFGDWFLLHLLSKNMRGVNFRKFMEIFAHDLKQKGETMESEPKAKLDYSTLPPLKPIGKTKLPRIQFK